MNWRQLSPALMTLLVFLLAQGIGVLLMIPFGMQPEQIPITAFSLILMAVDIVAVLACYLFLHNIRFKTAGDVSTIHWRTGMIAVAAGILGALCISILTEKVALPDVMVQLSLAMSQNFWGLLTLVIKGPV